MRLCSFTAPTVKNSQNGRDACVCGRFLVPGDSLEYLQQLDFVLLTAFLQLYPFPRLFNNSRGDCAVVFKDNDKGQWVDFRKGEGAYGGTWTENAVQAVARDLFTEAMPPTFFRSTTPRVSKSRMRIGIDEFPFGARKVAFDFQ